MRLHILSDLHQEFGEIDVTKVDCDCVILAGDISTRYNGLRWIQKKFPDVPVIYLCGNHEFYGDKLPKLTENLKEQCRGTNIHFLEDDAVTLGSFHFFGCTLWTDMALMGDWKIGAEEARLTMNDYKRVRNSALAYKRLSPQHTREIHLKSLARMREFLASHDPRRSIIVTHHAPSVLSLPEHRRTELISCAYASHLDDFIRQYQPSLWIHGHIHHSQDYYIGATRILANPRAYPDKPNPSFKPDLVIEV